MGRGEVFVCRLKEDNSNLYLDGSQANLTGPEGDVMVVFLEFWYKWYKVDDNRFLYHFADHDIDGTYIHVPQSLVGAYKGYVSSNRRIYLRDVLSSLGWDIGDNQYAVYDIVKIKDEDGVFCLVPREIKKSKFEKGE